MIYIIKSYEKATWWYWNGSGWTSFMDRSLRYPTMLQAQHALTRLRNAPEKTVSRQMKAMLRIESMEQSRTVET